MKHIKKFKVFESEEHEEDMDIDTSHEVAEPLGQSNRTSRRKQNDVLLGKMQIKFNNGILERTNSKRSMILESIRIRPGRPLSSWNFNLA